MLTLYITVKWKVVCWHKLDKDEYKSKVLEKSDCPNENYFIFNVKYLQLCTILKENVLTP